MPYCSIRRHCFQNLKNINCVTVDLFIRHEPNEYCIQRSLNNTTKCQIRKREPKFSAVCGMRINLRMCLPANTHTFFSAHKNQLITPLPPGSLNMLRFFLMVLRLRHDPAQNSDAFGQIVGYRAIFAAMRGLVCAMIYHRG